MTTKASIIFLIFILLSCQENKSSLHEKKVEMSKALLVDSTKNPSVSSPTETKKPRNDSFDPDFFDGRWEAELDNGFSFDLKMYIEDGFISGQYCAINETATRIDCGEMGVDDCYIRGPLTSDGGMQIVEIKSCYSGKTGKAQLQVVGEQIKWTIMIEPGKFGLDHFAPLEAVLHKVHFDPFE